jgi:DNA-binding response OmpR family regulator
MKKILLLEPDTVLGKTYQAALVAHGYDVSWYKDAQTAIHGVDKHAPDLVVAELQLATHNGVEFLYELRSYQDWRYIPVVVLSHVPPSNTNMNQKLRGHLLVVAYLYKPFATLAQLITSVDLVLSAKPKAV